MKRLALCLMLTVCQPAPAAEIKGNTITLTPAEMAACAEGCKLVTAASIEEFRQILLEAIKAAKTASAVCKRNSI